MTHFFSNIPERSCRIALERDAHALDEIERMANIMGYSSTREMDTIIVQGRVTAGLHLGIDPINATVMQFMMFFGSAWTQIPECITIFKRVDSVWKDSIKRRTLK